MLSMTNNHGIALKAKCWGREDPTVPSVTSLWQGADLQEREVYDLMGVKFTGHANMNDCCCGRDSPAILNARTTWSLPGRRGRMSIRTEPVTLNLGPQHPSTHGVFRMRVTFDGEIILDVEPVFGYLHRGSEKLAEERTYIQVVTLTDRLDYVSSMSNNLAYVLAVEKLAGVEPPERAMYMRVMVAELQRIVSHLVATGFFLNDLGALATPLMYCFREREKITGPL